MEGRYLHYYGALRIAVPTADRKLALLWLGHMGYDFEEAEAAWTQMTRRRNPTRMYASVVHFYDCDVTLEEHGSRRTVTLHAETRHPDSMHRSQVRADRAFKSPYPNRPLSGANLGDGFEQSAFHWSNCAGRATASGFTSPSRLRVVSPEQQQPVAASPTPAVAAVNRSPISPMDIVHRPSRLASPPAEAAKSPLAERREHAGWSTDGTLDPVEVSGRGNFVCGFTQIVALQQQVEQHARTCKHPLTWETRRMTQHALVGRCVARCSCATHGGQCTYLPNSELVWESSPRDAATGAYLANDLYCGAIGYTQSLQTASTELCHALMMKAPADKAVYPFVREQVAPVVHDMQRAEEERVAKDAIEERGFIAGGFDVAHDAVRNATNSAAATTDLGSGLILTASTLSEGTSASREPKLLTRHLQRVDELGVDLPVMTVDGCKDTAKIINSHQRIHAMATADRSKTTDTALDTWHGDKTGRQNMKKYVANSGPELAKFFSKTVAELATETGVTVTVDLMDEVIKAVDDTMNILFARANPNFEAAARSVEGRSLDWADGVHSADQLREFGSVLRASGGNNVTIDLTLHDDDDVDVEAPQSPSTSASSTAAADAPMAGTDATAEQTMLDAVNAIVRKRNADRTKQLSEFSCIGAINIDDPLLGKAELIEIVCALDRGSNREVVSKRKKADLQSLARNLLPAASCVKGGFGLAELLQASEKPVRDLFESHARGSKRGRDDEEKRLLKELTRLEAEKNISNPRESQAHPTFRGLDQLNPELLSPRQIKTVLDFLEVPLGEQPIETLKRELHRDVVGEVGAAVGEAVKLVEASRRLYFRQHSHAVRLVNETWGQTSRGFKAWCITHAMLNFGAHMCGDHANCKAHCWYAQCDATDYTPSVDPWTMCTGVGHPHGVPAIAALLAKAWTLGKYMYSLFYATALHCRTSTCESFFHAVDIHVPMWAGFSEQGYALGVACCHLTHNEQRRHKHLTTGKIVKTKWHPEGILSSTQHRPKVMLWRLDCQATVHSNFTDHISAWLRNQRTKASKSEQRRIAFVQRFEAAKAVARHQPATKSVLNQCPYVIPTLEMAYTETEGLIHLPAQRTNTMSMAAPFPLQEDALLPLDDTMVAELTEAAAQLALEIGDGEQAEQNDEESEQPEQR